jgi:hypothetical protein
LARANIVLDLDPLLHLAMHRRLPAHRSQLPPEVGKVFESKTGLHDTLEQKRVGDGLAQAGEVGQVGGYFLGRHAGLDVVRHVVGEAVVQAPVDEVLFCGQVDFDGYCGVGLRDLQEGEA